VRDELPDEVPTMAVPTMAVDRTPLGLDDVARSILEWNRSQGFYDRERLCVQDPVTGDVEARPLNPSLASEKLIADRDGSGRSPRSPARWGP
jgi:hypothetical protein